MKKIYLFLLLFALFNGYVAGIEKPNFIIFYVDDLGWQDTELNPMGDDVPWETPNLMKLATHGMNFTQAYSSAPTCSPSRGGILSGQHPAKTKLTHVAGAMLPTQSVKNKLVSPFYKDHIPDDALTIAGALRANGYRTGQIGKWHLGEFEEQVPTSIGFEYAFRDRGVHRGMDDRTKDFATSDPNDKYVLSTEKYPPVSDKNPEGISYPKDLVTDSAIAFISGSHDQPFFLYLAHWMVHYPTVTRNRALLEYYCDKLGIDFPEEDVPVTTPGQTNPYYGAMVTTVDWSLGRIMDLLETTDDPRNPGKKLIETTYIFFTSDNGGAEMHATEVITDNFPLDQGKKHVQEGGIRVPMVVTGPTITAGTEFNGLINQLDYFPTLMAYSNTTLNPVDAEKLDGLDISPVLNGVASEVKGADGKARENLFWHFPHNSDADMQSALRQGDYKLYKNHLDGSYELYRLYDGLTTVDLEEFHNIAGEPENAAVLEDMIAKLEAHLVENKVDYPSFNPTYSGDLAFKSDVPVIESNAYDYMTRKARVNLADGKTEVARAYVLVERSEGNELKYQKVEATIAPDKRSVSATIPQNRDKYVFVLIDANNFMVQSELYEVVIAESVQAILLKPTANTYYGLDQTAVLSSELQTAPDGMATYRITADVIPQSGKSIMSNPDDTSWGVAADDQGALNNKNYIFWGSTTDTVWVNNLKVVDFNANGGKYTKEKIIGVYFNSIDFGNGGSEGKDAIGITIGDSDFNLGNINTLNFKNDLSESASPTDFILYNALSDNMTANKWSVNGIEVSVEFGTITSTATKKNKSHMLSSVFFEPNPAQKSITLSVRPREIKFYNLKGQLVLEQVQGDKFLDISHLESGMYIVNLVADDGTLYVNRLLKY